MTRLALVLALVLVAGCGDDGFETVTIGGETFRLEIARDPNTRAQGLMHRDDVPADGGMLFVFPTPTHQSFWMAYCTVDIDIMYLDARGRITATYTMKARPPRGDQESEPEYLARMRADDYPSRMPAQYVIELAAGTLDRLGLGFGDRIDLDLDRLREVAEY